MCEHHRVEGFYVGFGDAKKDRLGHRRATIYADRRVVRVPEGFTAPSCSLYGIDLFANVYVTLHHKEFYDGRK